VPVPEVPSAEFVHQIMKSFIVGIGVCMIFLGRYHVDEAQGASPTAAYQPHKKVYHAADGRKYIEGRW